MQYTPASLSKILGTVKIISIFRLVCLFPGLLLRVQPAGDAAGPEPVAETALQSRRGSAPLLRIRHLHSRNHRLPIFRDAQDIRQG